MDSSTPSVSAPPQMSGLAVLFGLAAALVLVVLYLVLVVSIANSPAHSLDLLWGDRYFVAAIAAGFGLQAGLYAYVRLVHADVRATRSTGLMAGADTGTSTAAMVACCAHHVVGLSGAAVFLNGYRIPIIVAGLGINAAGIVTMLRVVKAAQIRLTAGSHIVVGGKA